MGIKGEARKWFTQRCLVAMTLSRLRRDIVHDKPDEYVPTIAVDVSVWIRAALGNSRADSVVSSQFHAVPPVPVMAVAVYVMKRAAQLKRAKFNVILVFDGQRNPLKEEENEERLSKLKLTENEAEMKKMIAESESHSTEAMLDIRKKILYPRGDITYEVLAAARRNQIYIVCAPFESDHQIKALQEQGLADAAITTDSDLTAQGVRYAIANMKEDGKIEVRDFAKLTQEVLPQLFGVDHPIEGQDLVFLCNMLGNDYLPDGLRGSGPADVIGRMKEYLAKPTLAGKTEYMQQYAANHDKPQRFGNACQSWVHSPVYKIIPGRGHADARSAFFAGECTVKLCSMSLEESYSFEPVNEKLGYNPLDELRRDHEASGPHPPTDLDFFCGVCWSRDGKPFEPVPAQLNNNGEETIHGAIIDFDAMPIKFVPSRSLETWLVCRGVPTPSLANRQELEDLVSIVRHYKVDALPKMVMRSGGGCVTVSVLKFEGEDDAVWQAQNDALAEIRSDKCACVEDPALLEEIFNLQHDSKRDRCLSHLKGGSYDLKDVKVTSNLKSDMMPGENLFVISFLCAPSQRGLGSEKKLYPVRLAFHTGDDGVARLLPAPFSICHCPVGIGPCAHKGGMVLMIVAMRDSFKQCDYDELTVRFPPNIHSVASQLFLVRHIHPPQSTLEYNVDWGPVGPAADVSGDDSGDDAPGSGDEGSDSGESDGEGESEATPRRMTTRSMASTGNGANNSPAGVSDDIALERLDASQQSEGATVSKDLTLAVKNWCDDIEKRLQATGSAQKVDTDVGWRACVQAAEIESDSGYLKRRAVRWNRIARAVRQKRVPASMISHYSEHNAVGGTDNGDDNLAAIMEYADDEISQEGGDS